MNYTIITMVSCTVDFRLVVHYTNYHMHADLLKFSLGISLVKSVQARDNLSSEQPI